MGSIQHNVDAKEIAIDAVIIRADGTKEDLGTLAHWKKSEEEPSRLLRFAKNLSKELLS
jgi:hypothetical protein